MPISHHNEFHLIEQWADILPSVISSKVLLSIGDDAACLADLKRPVFSCDALIENVHFRHQWISARQLGWKSMAVNISDMAAMGAAPVAAAVTLALPPQTETAWVENLYRGFADAAERFQCSIVGGDTTKSDHIMISVAMIGELISPHALRRDGAKDGDVILVTGTLADSAAGLAALESNKASLLPFEQHCIQKHLLPSPRVAEVRAALKAGKALHAAIDISDGIAGDAAHIATKSGLDLVIETTQLPISASCRQTAESFNADPLQWALAGGEDYELLLCVDPTAADNVIQLIQTATNTPVHRVGFCRESTSDVAKILLYGDGKLLPLPQSWRHF